MRAAIANHGDLANATWRAAGDLCANDVGF
jgi:hypothetical protein